MYTLGVVESRSIAAGAALADGMVKAANVELVRAATVCSGRYIIHVSGDRQTVATAVQLARESGYALTGSFVIANISSQVVDALKKAFPARGGDAIGVHGCRHVSSGIAAADVAVKRSSIRLLRLITGQGINGKSCFVISGDVASVEEAAGAAGLALGETLIEVVVLPRPDASVVRALTGGVR